MHKQARQPAAISVQVCPTTRATVLEWMSSNGIPTSGHEDADTEPPASPKVDFAPLPPPSPTHPPINTKDLPPPRGLMRRAPPDAQLHPHYCNAVCSILALLTLLLFLRLPFIAQPAPVTGSLVVHAPSGQDGYIQAFHPQAASPPASLPNPQHVGGPTHHPNDVTGWSHQGHGVKEGEATAAGGHTRVVYIPDLHGDMTQALAALTLAGLIDKDGQWVGGSSLLVQGGDVVDRGTHSLALLQLFVNLTVQAHDAGGQVVNLLGNHEMMLLNGDLRYFNKHELSGLGGGDSVAGRTALLGLLASGATGDLLRSRPLAHIARLNGDGGGGGGGKQETPGPCDMLFIHAAALPWMVDTVRDQEPKQDPKQEPKQDPAPKQERAARVVQAWNKATREGLASCKGAPCSKAQDGLAGRLLGGEGGVWSRHYTQHPEDVVCKAVAEVTSSLSVSRVVVGHTIQEGHKAAVRCGGRLVMADVGMSRAVGGTPGRVLALTCGGGGWEAQGEGAGAMGQAGGEGAQGQGVGATQQTGGVQEDGEGAKGPAGGVQGDGEGVKGPAAGAAQAEGGVAQGVTLLYGDGTDVRAEVLAVVLPEGRR